MGLLFRCQGCFELRSTLEILVLDHLVNGNIKVLLAVEVLETRLGHVLYRRCRVNSTGPFIAREEISLARVCDDILYLFIKLFLLCNSY